MGLRKFSILSRTLMDKSNLEGCGLWVTKNGNQKWNGEAEKEKEKLFITQGVKNNKNNNNDENFRFESKNLTFSTQLLQMFLEMWEEEKRNMWLKVGNVGA
ncbi:hypothetical protein E2542_SST15241 [Spatholobus suberectus]|nr:hypothetical protein E2542_SST15241 [Spatholobus suberectus]